MPPALNNARILPMAQAGFKRDVRNLFASVVDDIQRVVLAPGADADTPIAPSRIPTIQAQTAKIIMGLFVGADGRNAFAEDGVTAVSPYAKLLNKWYVYVVVQQVMAAHRWMKTNLPEDVFRYLQSGRVRPVRIVKEADNPYLRQDGETLDAYRARLANLRIFSPNPLAQYDPMHTWVDPNGYRLSDRVWRTGQATRDQIDALVTQGIRQGMSARDLARSLEAYLVPTQTGVRALRPFGGRFVPDGAAANALRLARTEISRANNQAAYIAAVNNPYAEGMDIARSANGDPTCPICPQHATIDMSGTRVRDPYPINSSFRVPPYHPHDMCNCRPAMAPLSQVTQQLRGVMQGNDQTELIPYTTPAQPNLFIQQLLGLVLTALVGRVLGGNG